MSQAKGPETSETLEAYSVLAPRHSMSKSPALGPLMMGKGCRVLMLHPWWNPSPWPEENCYMLDQEPEMPSMFIDLLLQGMVKQVDVKKDFLQEAAAASQGEQGPGPGSDTHYIQHRPPFSGLPSGERIPHFSQLLMIKCSINESL